MCSCLLLILRSIVSFSLKDKDGIRIESASAFYPFTVNLVNEIYGENLYFCHKVKMVSTSQVVNDIIDRKTDIAIVTAPSDDQKNMIEKSNIELEFKKIYLESLLIFVNKNNNIENLNIEQIKKMFYS